MFKYRGREKEYKREWGQANRERRRKYEKEWRENNQEKLNEQGRKRYALNPDKKLEREKRWRINNPHRTRLIRLKCLYGMTGDDFDKLLNEQKRLCPICGKMLENEICVDHDHETKKIRGLLHRKCNVALAGIELFRERLSPILTYLDNI